ncbi:MAG: hypothetical protein HY308_00540 [Gammaproteobacteria bacterium]|nr:hypothetical protein [Gammaproteobacteria bacterium]
MTVATTSPITLDGNTAVFDDGKGHVVRANAEDVRKLYHVFSGITVSVTDEDATVQKWWLVELEKTIIVIPEELTTMIYSLLSAWKGHLKTSQKGYGAVCDATPLSWRAMWLGFLPLARTKFAIFPREAFGKLRQWKVMEPLEVDDYV